MMAKKTPSLLNLAPLVVLYHLVAVVKDLESWQANCKRFAADPDLANLLRLLLAEGVLIKDLGLPA